MNNSSLISNTVLPIDHMSLPNEKTGKEFLPVQYVDMFNKGSASLSPIVKQIPIQNLR